MRSLMRSDEMRSDEIRYDTIWCKTRYANERECVTFLFNFFVFSVFFVELVRCVMSCMRWGISFLFSDRIASIKKYSSFSLIRIQCSCYSLMLIRIAVVVYLQWMYHRNTKPSDVCLWCGKQFENNFRATGIIFQVSENEELFLYCTVRVWIRYSTQLIIKTAFEFDGCEKCNIH